MMRRSLVRFLAKSFRQESLVSFPQAPWAPTTNCSVLRCISNHPRWIDFSSNNTYTRYGEHGYCTSGALMAVIFSSQASQCQEEQQQEEKKDSTKEYHTAQWRVYTDQARDLVRQKEYDQAQAYLEKAVEKAVKGFGADDPHVASAKQNLAELYRLTKQYDKAAPLYDDAIQILMQHYGMSDIRVAFALHNIAGFYLAQQALDKAEEYYQRSLQVKLAAVGPGHTETSSTLFHLSEVYWMQGDQDKAIEYGSKAVDALKTIGSNMMAYSRRQARLADMLLDSGHPDKAEKQLLEVQEVTPEEDFQTHARVWESLSKVYRAMEGRTQDAEACMDKALSIRECHKDEYPLSYSACLRRVAEIDLKALQETPSLGDTEAIALKRHACKAAQEATAWSKKTLQSMMTQKKKDTRIRVQHAALEVAQNLLVSIRLDCTGQESPAILVQSMLDVLENPDIWPLNDSSSRESMTRTEKLRSHTCQDILQHVPKENMPTHIVSKLQRYI
mmetsp:Transcript_6649/g.13201  ORF Transcript_6649/g.13201 Transcript_6649/m.13201 type:complete len:501 (+) Transcript_6649:35-1537(+)